MPQSEPPHRRPAEIPADRITRRHLEALHSFLLRRTRSLLAAHHPDSEEHRAVRALDHAIDTTHENIVFCLDHAAADEDALLEDLREDWGRLRAFALPWIRSPDYDEHLWPPVMFTPLRAAGLPPPG